MYVISLSNKTTNHTNTTNKIIACNRYDFVFFINKLFQMNFNRIVSYRTYVLSAGLDWDQFECIRTGKYSLSKRPTDATCSLARFYL